MDNMVDMNHPDIIKYINKVREHVDDENREFFDGLLDDDRNESVAEPETEEKIKARQDEESLVIQGMNDGVRQLQAQLNELNSCLTADDSCTDVERDKIKEMQEKLQKQLDEINSMITVGGDQKLSVEEKKETVKKAEKPRKKSLWKKVFGK